ncbi:hypothetical protein VB780_06940 [Leptolyngbya sp. CCNP1308]|uniref:hypothetical protein n=1 Tax=Leptolyngbya sp. CCNP1308 TaxID=3110255 RepID=UPI002B212BF2|nr:hypothetical protein [Leptolyngbya sp. CCNP1308]MEA5448296.1 hypothetical protein [Leptolyngbya sp. CCNP1308]
MSVKLMIYESRFWKNDLLKQANSLRSRMLQKRWPEASFARLEQDMMLGFYSIRKLIESKKLSDAVANQSLEALSYEWMGEPVTLINKNKIEKLYNLNSGHKIQKKLIFFCHQFIHSYIFEVLFDENYRLNGIFISSDKERNKALYLVKLQSVIDIFEQVGSDYPTNLEYTINFKTLEYDVKAWSQKIDQ